MKHIKMRFLLLPGLFLAMVLPLQGATYVWDTSTAAGYQAGDGNWEPYSTSQMWNTDGGGVNLVYWADGNDAVFSANGTSNVSVTTVSASSVRFDGTGCTLNGYNLTNTGDYIVNQDATVNASLGGSLYVGGPKTLTIAGGLYTTNTIVIAHGSYTEGHVVQSNGDVYATCSSEGSVAYVLISGYAEGAADVGSYELNNGTLTFGQGMYLGFLNNNTGTFIQNGGLVQGGTTTEGIRMSCAGGTGNYYLNGGTLNAYLNSYQDGTDNFYFGGGTLQASFNFNTNNGTHGINTTIVAGAQAVIDTNGRTVTWSDPIQGSGDNGLYKTGAGTLNLNGNLAFSGGITVNGGLLNLNGANTYAGNTVVNGGFLVAKNPGALPGYNTPGKIATSASGVVGAGIGGTGEWSEADAAAFLTAMKAGNVTAALDTTNAPGGEYVFSATLAGDLRVGKTGKGVLTLPAENTYTGGTTSYVGTVKATGNASFGSGTVTTSWYVDWSIPAVAYGGGIDLNGCTIGNKCYLTGAGDMYTAPGAACNTSAAPAEITGTIELGDTLVYVGGPTTAGDMKFSGPISGSSGIFKWGTHTLTISGTANTFDAPTLIESGTLEVAKLANLGESSSLGKASSPTNNQILFYNYYGTDAGQTLRYVGSTASVTDRELIFNYAGAMGEVLTVADNIVDASGTTPSATVTFTANASFNMVGVANHVTLTGTNTGDNTFAGDIVGNGSLTKDGPGKWVLSGVKSYMGDTTVLDGILQADAIVNSPNVSVSGGELIAGSITVGALTIGAVKGYANEVPEPSTIILLLLAAGGLLSYRRYRGQ
jgi:fibronectin-binding autotransporter adhesin